MSFFRQYIAPLFIVLIFAIALLATSARIFLPSDMMAPAPGSQFPSSQSPASQSTEQPISSIPSVATLFI